MDLHPVAVTLARVTYLLAIGRDRLTNPARGTIQIPVYLGDSLQWQEQSRDLWSAGNLTISIDDDRELFSQNLNFPDALLEDAARFDELVNEMASRAANRRVGTAAPSLKAVFQRLSVSQEHREVLGATFRTMCQLHDEGRDHIWGYFVRNLARPMWLAREANRVDVLVGNPPWLAYRNMSSDMQATFRRMSEARGLWAGAKLATHLDLAGLFAIRACELYLRDGGKFGLVLPNTAIDREHYRGFRSGLYGDATMGISVAFSSPWDLRRIRPHFFPRASSVVFGTRSDGRHVSMPEAAEVWTGRLSFTNASWDETSDFLGREAGTLRRGEISESPYASAFTQGAIFSPHLVFVVAEQGASALGMPAGRTAIQSSRSVYEQKPWKELPDQTGVIETEFLRPFYSGEHVFPFRVEGTGLVAVPCGARGILDEARIQLSPGYSQWWEKAEELWEANRSTDRLSLLQQIDYQSKLSKQFPVSPLRIVYNRAGMHVVAAKVRHPRALIANGLYWAPMRTEDEADYLCAILNAPITTELTRPHMSYGKDERDIHKAPWKLPIPQFEPSNATHHRLAELGGTVERISASFEVTPNLHFAALRRHIRQMVEATAEGQEINEIVYELIS